MVAIGDLADGTNVAGAGDEEAPQNPGMSAPWNPRPSVPPTSPTGVPFPLPRIDQIVDSTAGCELLCFLDAYSGYHQIKMKESDQLTTSFITPFGRFCYITMPFGLRNASAMYQRCMQHVFGDRIGRTVEAYVDDIVVKNRKADDLVNNLRISFDYLRANRVKLNPEKCVFGVPRGMLLGYIVS
jgi:hypothetical protein